MKYYYRAGQLISVIGSTLCVAVYVIFLHYLCRLFGADAETLEFTAIHMWEYCWGFIVGSVNTLLSAYFYSTKRSGQAIARNVVRSLVMNTLIITFVPKLLGSVKALNETESFINKQLSSFWFLKGKRYYETNTKFYRRKNFFTADFFADYSETGIAVPIICKRYSTEGGLY